MDKSLLAAEILGWYGAIAILLAYALVSFSVIAGDSILFQLLNITGSIGLLLIAFAKRVYQSVILNIEWALIGTIAIAKLFL